MSDPHSEINGCLCRADKLCYRPIPPMNLIFDTVSLPNRPTRTASWLIQPADLQSLRI